MKKYKSIKIIAFLIVMSASFVNAQSGLQFSQVILINSNSQTVPVGKAWKVESILSGNTYPVSSNCTSPSYNGNYGTALFIDNNIYYSDVSNNAGTNYSSIMFSGSRSFPLWLPAGTNLKTACSSSIATVIEFTVIP
jgi:hypothetical protein